MDRTAALLCLVFLSPIFFFTAILLYLFYGSPIIFPQERLGINKKIFLIYKFRSMKSIASDEYKEFPDNARLTPLYRFIRRFKIDELPHENLKENKEHVNLKKWENRINNVKNWKTNGLSDLNYKVTSVKNLAMLYIYNVDI